MSERTLTAAAMYFGSTLRMGDGARSGPPAATDGWLSANQIIQLP